MGAKKLYINEIMRLVEELPEEDMPAVVHFISQKLTQSDLYSKKEEQIQLQDRQEIINLIEKGYWKNKISGSNTFAKTKEEEKLLDL